MKLKVRIARDVDHTQLVNIELTDDQLQRNDEIDNAVFDCIKILAEDPLMEWNMRVIGNVTESIKHTLFHHGIPVRHPGISVDLDGFERVEEYDIYSQEQFPEETIEQNEIEV